MMHYKNYTYVKVGHTSELPVGIYWQTLKNPKNQNFEKIKKNKKTPKNWRYHHVYQKPQKTKTLKKMKKASADVIILNLCNKKHNKMMYAYSDMECDRHNFLLF